MITQKTKELRNYFQDEELSHESNITTRLTNIIRYTFANNMSTDIKLSKIQISEIIKLDVSYGSGLDNLGKKVLINVGIPFTKDNLPGLARKITSNAINKCQRKVNGKRGAKA